MKIINKIVLLLFLVSFVFTSCKKMLEVDTNRSVNPNGYKFNTPDDNVYAISGLLTRLEKIAERYVLLGELRGDLMDITPNANSYLQQIYNFEVTADNPYTSIKDYYAVINNCNYIINNIDTSVWSGGEQVMKQGYAAAKGFRAWVYMQIALNYDSVIWFDKPLLNVEEATGNYPKYNLTQLAGVLISDLRPIVNIPVSTDFSSTDFFPIRYLLGELYLWTEDYEKAANEYYNLLVAEGITNTSYYRWVVSNGEFTPNITTNNIYINPVTGIFITSRFGEGIHLNDYSLHTSLGGLYWIKPSQVSINNWDSTTYYDKDTVSQISGDLRGMMYSYESVGNSVFTNYGKSINGSDNYISMFSGLDRYALVSGIKGEEVYIITPALVYLRYAEAVNRLRKPNLAFAVLKSGLKPSSILRNVPSNEKTPLPGYMDFSDVRFNGNIGIHAHGCGYTETADAYKIPMLATLDDSMIYVEDQIVKELALETAFDGNRFQDLMRIALRRNDPSYLANTVAEKYTGNKEAIRAKLMDINNWYLPKK